MVLAYFKIHGICMEDLIIGNAISQSAQQLNQNSNRNGTENKPTIWESTYGCKQEVWLLNKCGKE